MRLFLFRSWRYFREGYGLYISLPVGILNFLTITYYILLERIPTLKSILPHFTIFATIALLTVFPLATFLGWLHIRRSRAFSTELIIATETNPITIRSQRVGMEMTIQVLKALNIPITKDYEDLFQYWKRLDEKVNWQP